MDARKVSLPSWEDVAPEQGSLSDALDCFLSGVYHKPNESKYLFQQIRIPLLDHGNRSHHRRGFRVEPDESKPRAAADPESDPIPYPRANAPTYA
jgi:hypothetical protein